MDAIHEMFENTIISKKLWLLDPLILVSVTFISGKTISEKCTRKTLALSELSRM
jgi:hypothetical protein